MSQIISRKPNLRKNDWDFYKIKRLVKRFKIQEIIYMLCAIKDWLWSILIYISFLAHLSQSDRVSFCDRFSSGVRPSGVRP
jgi:hypothetical protein